MKLPKISRRKFIRLLLGSLPACCAIDAFFIEPEWIVVNNLRIGKDNLHKIVHFTDLHYKGNKDYIKKLTEKINLLSPDYVCFTGDLIEDSHYLKEALLLLTEIRFPVIGVPGNHDYWSGASFKEIAKYFAATGGAWLVNEELINQDGRLRFIGTNGKWSNFSEPLTGVKDVLLCHYPLVADNIKARCFDLILAGHSHGGQISIPFVGPLYLPRGVGKYVRGYYSTKAGPLYVSSGIGTWLLPTRFCCRPEITVIEL